MTEKAFEARGVKELEASRRPEATPILGLPEERACWTVRAGVAQERGVAEVQYEFFVASPPRFESTVVICGRPISESRRRSRQAGSLPSTSFTACLLPFPT